MSTKDYIRDPILSNLGVFSETQNIYVIPHYQRSYAWAKDRAVAFWEELLIPDNKTDFNLSFTGSIILKHNKKTDKPGYFDLIDGQQRFITTSIFIAVIRDFSKYLIKTKYKKSSKKEKYEEIIKATETMLRIKRLGVEEATPRVKVGKIIYDVYDQIIVNPYGWENVDRLTLASRKNTSEQNILRNYKAFGELLEKYITETSDEDYEYVKIIELINSLKEIDFIQITVTDDVAAYEIFETVNSKNEPLTSSDLIKNQILMQIKNADEYEDKWNESIKNISEVNGFNFNQFLRYYWLSKYGWTTDKKLYANFKWHLNKYKTKSERVKFLSGFVDEILENSLYFRRLLNPGYDSFYKDHFASPKQYDKKIIRALQNTGKLNVKQCYVLLLSLIRNVVKAKSELKESSRFEKISRAFTFIVRNIETFSLRFHVLGKFQANKVEKSVYHEIAMFIENDLINDKNDNNIIKKWTYDLKNKINLTLENTLEDEDFIMNNAMKRLDYTKTVDYNIIRFAYELINQNIFGEKQFSFNEEECTHEHILPRNPSKWGLKAEQIEPFVNRIGNIIIINEELNRWLGNETLENKINGVKNSAGKIKSYFNDTTKCNIALYKKIKEDLPNFDNNGAKYWNAEKIEERINEISENFEKALEIYNNGK